jgi:lantibiotic transport system ATP-binding protein
MVSAVLKIQHLYEKSLKQYCLAVSLLTMCLIEQPSLYEHLSGFDNLEITRRIRNVNKSQIDRVLMLVDLKAPTHCCGPFSHKHQ